MGDIGNKKRELSKKMYEELEVSGKKGNGGSGGGIYEVNNEMKKQKVMDGNGEVEEMNKNEKE